MKGPFFAPAAATALALCACGSLDANTNSTPVLAKLSGRVLNPNSLALNGSVRVAVVWKVYTPVEFNVAEDLPVQPAFPMSFTIELDAPPPPEAMSSAAQPSATSSPPTAMSMAGGGPIDAGAGAAAAVSKLEPVNVQLNPNPNLKYAVGSVVAYVDRNGNGKLDLVPEDASTSIDAIVATNSELTIIYFEGPITDTSGVPLLKDAAGHLPTDGYNLAKLPQCNRTSGVATFGAANPACLHPPPPPTFDAGPCSGALEWLPTDTRFDLTVATVPEVASLICQNGAASASNAATGSGGPPSDPSVQPAQYPDPCDPNLQCAQDGSDYMLFSCTTVSQGICRGTITTCTSVGYARPTPVPAGWPCIH
jgi:hypothetical protein